MPEWGAPRGRRPGDVELRAALAQAVGAARADDLDIERARNATESTFASDIVRCRLPDGTTMIVFCKYGDAGDRPRGGHRGGVAYEALVHREVLSHADTPAPRFVGAHAGEDGATWLFTEHLEDAVRVRDLGWDAFVEAARCAGVLHAATAPLATGTARQVLTVHDAAYHRAWAARAIEQTRDIGGDADHLADVTDSILVQFDSLFAGESVVVHGEFYPGNVLVQGGRARPIDWESAAIGVGETDLAAILEGCPPVVAAEAVSAYRDARGDSDAASERRLRCAQVLLHVRWLGGRIKPKDKPFWRLSEIRRLVEELDLTSQRT